MKVEITVGLDEYDGIGTSEAYFMFNDFSEIQINSYSLSLSVWGVDFSTRFLGGKIKEYLNNPSFNFVSEEIHIIGKTSFTFHNVVKVSKSERNIILETNIENKQPVPYVIGGVLPNKNYFDELTIEADKFFTMSFDTDDFISITEFCKNPKAYSYKR